MWVLGVAVVVLLVLWILAIQGRRNAPGLHALDGWLYAHRGYHREPDAPENSRKAFALAVENGLGSELDVHLLKDGKLGVLHDSSLKRMTGESLIIEDLTEEELKNHHLGDSQETIPTLREVLDIYAGKAPLIIELKTHKKNAVPLCEAVMKELEGYQGLYCIESFDPRVVRWLRWNRPEIIRGQLSTNFFKDEADLSFFTSLMATELLENFLTRPDFIAYNYKFRHRPSNVLCLRLWRLAGASWTIRRKEDLEVVQKDGLWPIFENFDPVTGERFPKKKGGNKKGNKDSNKKGR